jgi:hypothetical protein
MTVRVLDVGSPYPFKRIVGKPRNLAWPVAAFRITLPDVLASTRSVKNPFEEVILGLLELYENVSPEVLAEKTCLPVDMVRTVLLRLQDKNVIDSTFRPVAVNARRESGFEPQPKYSAALVFVEQVSGKLLPHMQMIDDNTPLRTRLLDVARVLRRDDRYLVLRAPKPRQIADVVAKMQRRLATFGKSTGVTLAESQIGVAQEPEAFHLDCPIALRMGDGEFRIADPFGTGFSSVLEKAFQARLEEDEQLREWMVAFRRSQVSNQTTSPTAIAQPFDTPRNRRLYPNLVEALRPISFGRNLSIDQVYAAVEWTLYYSCQIFGLSEPVRLIQSLSPESYGKWMEEAATKLGLDVPRAGFRPIWQGKLRDIEEGKAELDALIAISLVQAHAHAGHPLWQVASEHPDFLTQLRRLKMSRDRKVHGKEEMEVDNPKLTSEEFLRSVITTFIPSMMVDEASKISGHAELADELLEARNRLEERIGYAALKSLPRSVSHRLLNAERDLIAQKDGDNFLALIICLCAAVEIAIRDLPRGKILGHANASSAIEVAQERCLEKAIGALPASLASVNTRRIQSALTGEGGSLGASAIVMIVTLDDHLFDKFAESGQEILSVIDALLSSRGHGNNPIYLKTSEANWFVDGAVMVVRELWDLGK